MLGSAQCLHLPFEPEFLREQALLQMHEARDERDLAHRSCHELREEVEEANERRQRAEAALALLKRNASAPAATPLKPALVQVASPAHHGRVTGMDVARKREVLRLMGAGDGMSRSDETSNARLNRYL